MSEISKMTIFIIYFSLRTSKNQKTLHGISQYYSIIHQSDSVVATSKLNIEISLFLSVIDDHPLLTRKSMEFPEFIV